MPTDGVPGGVDPAVIAAAIEAAVAAGFFAHGGPYGRIEMPDPTNGACCIGNASMGPKWCTCWVTVYDLDQQEPRLGEAGRRASPCADCAYRKDSPERQGDERYKGSEDGLLDRIVVTGEPFWCHVGMRQPVKLVHPSGAEVDLREVAPGAYHPPVVGTVPYKANGAPGDVCAGWAVRRARYLEREAAAS